MSENDSGAEKTLDPTEKRIRESRERGEVARSKELTTAAVTITASVALLMSGRSVGVQLAGIFRDSFRVDHQSLEDPSSLTTALAHAIVVALGAVTPILAAAAIAAFLAPLALGGWIFSPAALIPINIVSTPERAQPASDHRLLAAPIAKNTRPVATTLQARL